MTSFPPCDLIPRDDAVHLKERLFPLLVGTQPGHSHPHPYPASESGPSPSQSTSQRL